MDGEDSSALSALRRALGTLAVYKKTTFVASRKRNDGSSELLTIEILDAGPDVPPGIRFECVASTEDGKSVSGMPCSTAKTALELLHWEELK
jgi:hypothetical protein